MISSVPSHLSKFISVPWSGLKSRKQAQQKTRLQNTKHLRKPSSTLLSTINSIWLSTLKRFKSPVFRTLNAAQFLSVSSQLNRNEQQSYTALFSLIKSTMSFDFITVQCLGEALKMCYTEMTGYAKVPNLSEKHQTSSLWSKGWFICTS